MDFTIRLLAGRALGGWQSPWWPAKPLVVGSAQCCFVRPLCATVSCCGIDFCQQLYYERFLRAFKTFLKLYREVFFATFLHILL